MQQDPFDEAQGSAVVLQYFATANDMDAGGKVMAAMDTSQTPGTRTSVDACELKHKLEAWPARAGDARSRRL